MASVLPVGGDFVEGGCGSSVQCLNREKQTIATSNTFRRGGMTMASQSKNSQRKKRQYCDRYMQYLRERTDVDVDEPGFVDAMRKHFECLPSCYAADVNLTGKEVMKHKELLERVRQYPESVAFLVRDVELVYPRLMEMSQIEQPAAGNPDQQPQLERTSNASIEHVDSFRRQGLRPSFPSSSSLQNLSDMSECMTTDDELVEDLEVVALKEIIIAARDRPQLLSGLSKAMADAHLDIREAHAFSTNDGYSFDVFVVTSSEMLGSSQLEAELRGSFHQMLLESLSGEESSPGTNESHSSGGGSEGAAQTPMALPADDWEVKIDNLEISEKIASSTFGQIYKGQYYGQDVAVKIIKDVMENARLHNEFMQEVSIMKKVRHKNVVQFIGACTVQPSLCILFEYMENGSVHDYLRKGPLSLVEVLRIALDVARGMDYLHRQHIIHRDLKAANLLIDGTDTVKIADFGVAKILDKASCSTAETGTYRWMAPEVIEHREYSHKVDVYSFSILLWELLTGEVPYNEQTPIQAAVSVVQRNLRPQIPRHCPVHLAHLMHTCWARDPATRPEFFEIAGTLKGMLDAEKQNADDRRASAGGASRGLFSKLRRQGFGSR